MCFKYQFLHRYASLVWQDTDEIKDLFSDFPSWRISTLLLLQKCCLKRDFCCLNKQVLQQTHWLSPSFLGSRLHYFYRQMHDFFPISLQHPWDSSEEMKLDIEKIELNITSSTGGEGAFLASCDGKLPLWSWVLAFTLRQLKNLLRGLRNAQEKGKFPPPITDSQLACNKYETASYKNIAKAAWFFTSNWRRNMQHDTSWLQVFPKDNDILHPPYTLAPSSLLCPEYTEATQQEELMTTSCVTSNYFGRGQKRVLWKH